MRQLPVLTLVALLVGCASAPNTPNVAQGKPLGQSLSHRFRNPADADEQERPPSKLDADVLDDLIVMRSRDATKVCFGLSLQTEQSYALSGNELRPTCRLDNTPVPATIKSDQARLMELWYEVFVLTSLAWVDKVFYVMTRELEVCCPGSALEVIELELENELMGSRPDQPWRLVVRWEL